MRTEEEIKDYLAHLKKWEETFLESVDAAIDSYNSTGLSINLKYIVDTLSTVQEKIQIIEWILGKESSAIHFSLKRKE